MTAYMFQFELPAAFSDEMAAVIPAQRARVNQLFLDGKLLSYSVSQLRTALWCVVAAQDEQEAMEVAASFPIHPYFTDVMCQPLLFHNVMPAGLPEFSLN